MMQIALHDHLLPVRAHTPYRTSLPAIADRYASRSALALFFYTSLSRNAIPIALPFIDSGKSSSDPLNPGRGHSEDHFPVPVLTDVELLRTPTGGDEFAFNSSGSENDHRSRTQSTLADSDVEKGPESITTASDRFDSRPSMDPPSNWTAPRPTS